MDRHGPRPTVPHAAMTKTTIFDPMVRQTLAANTGIGTDAQQALTANEVGVRLPLALNPVIDLTTVYRLLVGQAAAERRRTAQNPVLPVF